MDSPPASGVEAPESPTSYSLDLDALNLDDTTPLSPIPGPKIDRIISDDIEGPSDFTINLGKYMNGTPGKRRIPEIWNFSQNGDETLDEEADGEVLDARQARSSSRQAEGGNGKSDQHANVDAPEELSINPKSAHDQSSGASNAQPSYEDDNYDSGEDELSIDNTNTGTDLLLNDLTEGSTTPRREETQEEESSIWDPQHNSSSLGLSHPGRSRSLLQPTVEDYNSDLTPVRPHSTVPQPTFHLTPDPPRRAASALNVRPSPRPSPRPSSANRPSSPTLSPVRTPQPTRTAMSSNAHDLEMQHLRAELDELRKAQAQAQTAVETLNTQVEKERQNARTLKSDLELVRERNHEMEQAAHVSRQEHEREMHELMTEVDSMRRSEKEVLRLAEQRGKDLDAARRAEREAKQLADEREKELDQMHESEDAELQEFRWQLQQAQDSGKSAKEGLDDLRLQMEQQGRAHDEEVQRLGRDVVAARTEVHRAKEAEKSAQENLRLLRQQLNEHATALRDETQRLRKELDEAHGQEENARSDADRYYNELQQLKAAQDVTVDDPMVEDSITTTASDATNDKEARRTVENQLRVADSQIAKLTRELRVEQEAKKKAESELAAACEEQKADQAARKSAEDQIATITREREADQEARIKADNSIGKIIKRLKSERDARLKAEAQLAAVTEQYKEAQQARDLAQEEAIALKEELEMMQNLSKLDIDTSDAPMESLNAGYDKAMKLAESLRSEMENLKKQMMDQQKKHQSQMKSVKSKHTSQVASVKSQQTEQREADKKQREAEIAEHRRMISLLEESIANIRHDRAASTAHISALKQQCELTQESLRKTEQSLEELKDTVRHRDEAMEAIKRKHIEELMAAESKRIEEIRTVEKRRDEEIKAAQRERDEQVKVAEQERDERIFTTLRKREDGWKQKVKDARKLQKAAEDRATQLNKECIMRGKMLMLQWGREECGIAESGEPQKYAYKYVKEKAKAKTKA